MEEYLERKLPKIILFFVIGRRVTIMEEYNNSELLSIKSNEAQKKRKIVMSHNITRGYRKILKPIIFACAIVKRTSSLPQCAKHL